MEEHQEFQLIRLIDPGAWGNSEELELSSVLRAFPTDDTYRALRILSFSCFVFWQHFYYLMPSESWRGSSSIINSFLDRAGQSRSGIFIISASSWLHPLAKLQLPNGRLNGGLYPFLSVEICHHYYHHEKHKHQDCRIAPARFQLRHKSEVHAIQPCQESERNEYCGDDG